MILPMCVIRRMDAVLEPTKSAVLDTKKMLDDAKITGQNATLCDAAGQTFYNTSRFRPRDLASYGSLQQLLADFEDYLDGFSPNVQDIINNFKFRNQLPTLSRSDSLGTLIGKFLDPEVDLSPTGIDNHLTGTIFEELVRRFMARRSTRKPARSARPTCCSRAKGRTRTTSSAVPSGPPSLAMPFQVWSSTSCSPIHHTVKAGKMRPDPLHGLFEAQVDGKSVGVEYEADSDLRDTEQVPLLEEGGTEAFIRREVLPYTPDAWIKEDSAKIGYEISFTRHFYKPQSLRSLEEITADIRAVEKESEGLLDGLLTGGRR